MTLQERLNAVVTDLRACDSRDQVAELLAKASITGWPGLPCDCPLAVLIKRRTGAEKVHVGAGLVEVWAPGEYAWGDLPAVADEFVHRFDEHGYEDLEEPGSTCRDSRCGLCFPEVSAA